MGVERLKRSRFQRDPGAWEWHLHLHTPWATPNLLEPREVEGKEARRQGQGAPLSATFPSFPTSITLCDPTGINFL